MLEIKSTDLENLKYSGKLKLMITHNLKLYFSFAQCKILKVQMKNLK